MRLEPKHIVFILGLLLLAVTSAFAQEGGSMESMENEKEKAQQYQQYAPSGDDYNSYKAYHKTISRDSLSKSSLNYRMGETQRIPSTEKQGNNKSEDNSILSFNFLYYIIQKFKMSDIVDQ